MTEEDYTYWVSRLGRTPRQRILALRDLLKHANGDGMTDEDRALCHRALGELGTAYVKERVGATKTYHSIRRMFQRAVIDSDENHAHIERRRETPCAPSTETSDL